MLRSSTPSEADTLRAITDYLEVARILYVRINPTSPILDEKRIMGVLADLWNRKISMIEAFSRIRTMIFRPLRESQQGVPDLIVFPGLRRTLLIEVKSPTGRLSEKQKHWQAYAAVAGLRYMVVRSVDECLRLMSDATAKQGGNL